MLKFDELALAARIFSDPAAAKRLRAADRSKPGQKQASSQQVNDLILSSTKQSAHAVQLAVKNAGSSGLLWERDSCVEVKLDSPPGAKHGPEPVLTHPFLASSDCPCCWEPSDPCSRRSSDWTSQIPRETSRGECLESAGGVCGWECGTIRDLLRPLCSAATEGESLCWNRSRREED